MGESDQVEVSVPGSFVEIYVASFDAKKLFLAMNDTRKGSEDRSSSSLYICQFAPK